MADNKLEQMLEKLVNNDRAGADELFHEFVIEKSRGIYEKMLETDLEDLEVAEETDEEVDETTDEEVDEATDEEVDEASDDEDLDETTDEEVEENFGEFTPEADPMGGDKADDFIDDIEANGDEMDMGDEMDDADVEDRVVDLEDALDDLKAEFEKMMSGEDDSEEAGDDEADMDMDDEDEGDEDEQEESYETSELSDEVPAYEGTKTEGEQMREYVEKVSAPTGEDNKATSPVASKNDMGGTTANIAKGGTGSEAGSAMSAKEDNAGNVNVPGGKASKSMSNAKAPATGEKAANTKSVVGK